MGKLSQEADEPKPQGDAPVEGKPIGPRDKEFSPVDDFDWFKLSRSWVNGRDERLVKQIENLQGAVKWFFTLGSSAAILTVLLKEPHVTAGGYVLFGVALLLLFSAYAISVFAITLVSRNVDEPNNGNSIREAFNKANVQSRHCLVAASFCLMAGMTLFSLGVMMSYEKPEPPKKEMKMDFKASLVVVDKTVNAKSTKYIVGLRISGYMPDSSAVRLKLEKGPNLMSTIVLDTVWHPLQHPRFDLYSALHRQLPLESGKYFLTLINKNNIAVSKIILNASP